MYSVQFVHRPTYESYIFCIFYILYFTFCIQLQPIAVMRCNFLIFMDFDLFAFTIFFIKWYNAQYKYICSYSLSKSQTLNYFPDSTMYDLHSIRMLNSVNSIIPYAEIHFMSVCRLPYVYVCR